MSKFHDSTTYQLFFNVNFFQNAQKLSAEDGVTDYTLF